MTATELQLSPFSHLPNEILLKVLKAAGPLLHFAQVCKRWRDVADEDRTSLTFFGTGCESWDPMLSAGAALRSSRLKKISFSSGSRPDWRSERLSENQRDLFFPTADERLSTAMGTLLFSPNLRIGCLALRPADVGSSSLRVLSSFAATSSLGSLELEEPIEGAEATPAIISAVASCNHLSSLTLSRQSSEIFSGSCSPIPAASTSLEKPSRRTSTTPPGCPVLVATEDRLGLSVLFLLSSSLSLAHLHLVNLPLDTPTCASLSTALMSTAAPVSHVSFYPSSSSALVLLATALSCRPTNSLTAVALLLPAPSRPRRDAEALQDRCSDNPLPSLLKLLQAHSSSLHHVSLSCSFLAGPTSEADGLSSLLLALKSLPNLRSLSLPLDPDYHHPLPTTFCPIDPSFQTHTTTPTVAPHGLRCLALTSVTLPTSLFLPDASRFFALPNLAHLELQGGDLPVHQLSLLLACSKSLKYLDVSSCHLFPQDSDSASKPTANQWRRTEAPAPTPTLLPSGFALQLDELRLAVPYKLICPLVDAVTAPTCLLRSLHVEMLELQSHPHRTRTANRELSRLLASSPPLLKSLHVSLEDARPMAKPDVTSLLSALSSHRSLESLTLATGFELDDSFAPALSAAVAGHASLRHVEAPHCSDFFREHVRLALSAPCHSDGSVVARGSSPLSGSA